jgi:diaminohydroxyphosphoribosylaminopyrimidine deaminase/5-amino-6-(5-phosphoribosylamino)uracil reductase
VQEVAAVIAPKLLGGESARTPLGLLGAQTMAEVRKLGAPRVEWLVGDLLWRAAVDAPGGER